MTAYRRHVVTFIAALCLLAVLWAPAQAQEEDEAARMARLLQDPLATLAALMTDNTINFDQGDDNDTGYNFQLQPVYSLPAPQLGLNFVPRAVIPIIGAPRGSDFPRLGDRRREDDTTWGLSDSALQLFISPRSESAWKWGVGPQFSLRTRTDSQTAGAGWGGGLSGVIVGGAGAWSFSGIAGHMWGQDGFSTTAIQPIIYYNFESLPGFAVFYNNTI